MAYPETSGPLDFSDWLPQRDNTKASGWIVVGQLEKSKNGQTSTFSYLVNTARLEERLLVRGRGMSSDDAGREIIDAYLESRAYGSTQDPEWDLRDPDNPVAGDKRPFVVETFYHGYRPLEIDLIQAFVLYWNAWWDGEILRRIDNDGVAQEVSRKTKNGEWVVLEVDAHHLRQFLSVAGAGLVRIHDHMRFANERAAVDVDDSPSDETGTFTRRVSSADPIASCVSFGRVHGKDVVLPYNAPDDDPLESVAGYERFIVGRETSGADRQASSDESLGEAPFLTPVYFRSEVLRRYYDAPRTYTVNTGFVRCLDLWSIDFDRRRDDLVQVWLGDLGRIPHVDQRHWRAHNVAPPEAGVSEERFRRDFLAEWVDPKDDLAFEFKRALREVNEVALKVLGQSLFRPLSAADQHVSAGLRVPFSSGPEESDLQLTGLAKITVESLDNDLLRAQLPQGTDVAGLPSIALLEKVLEAWSAEDLAGIVGTHRELQALRSTGSAHRRGSKWEVTLRQAGLLDLDNKELVAEMLRRGSRALAALGSAIIARAPRTSSRGG